MGTDGARSLALDRDEAVVIGDECGEPGRPEAHGERMVACRAVGHPGVDQRRERQSLAFRMTITRRDEDPDLDVEVTDHPELRAEQPELPDTLADDRTLERIAEHPPAGPNATAGDAHRVDFLRVLPVDRARDTGEHPRQVEAKDLPSRLRPGIVGTDLGRAGESKVIGGSERGGRGLGARDEGRFGGPPGSDGSQPARLGQTESRRGLGLVR
jgi:hypothetical protein